MGRAASLFLVLIVVSGCSSAPRVVVGSKNFTEQVLLGEIVAQQLERLNITVERRLNLGGTLLAHEALRSGAIDLYPEYTGTALTAVLRQPPLRDSKAVLARVREGYSAWHLVWLEAPGFNNSFAMVVRAETARSQGLATLSDAARRAQPWRLGVGYEFVHRPDGLSGLVQTYGLRIEGAPVTMDLGLLYSALESRRVDIAAASATDARLAQPEFVVLADDRAWFPPYECAIVVREQTLERQPRVRTALEQLRISDAEMRRLNAAVDIAHRRPADVAREFLDRRETKQ